ncbi:MAG TPA: glycosyltransferase family A protein [Methyloversatilis sp.]
MKRSNEEAMRTLTILICTHNRRALLAKTLHSLEGVHRPDGWQVDIFVMANACSDDTLPFLKTYHGSLPLRFDEELHPGKSHALNHAFSLLDSDLVAFVDDDHRVAPGYLDALTSAFDQECAPDLICGRILPDWDGSEPGWVHEKGRYRIYPLPVPRFDMGDTACPLTPERGVPGGGNLAVRREWLNRIGPFSTELGPQGHNLGGAEDIDWVLRGLSLGAKLYYTPAMLQYHYVDGARLRTGYIVRKAFIRSSSVARVDGVKPAAYMLRKALGYLGSVATSLSSHRRRHYLVRLAASLGELHGALKNR